MKPAAMFFSRFARSLVLAITVAVGGGCFSTQPVGALLPVQDLPPRLSVYRYTGEIVFFEQSRVEADTIIGFLLGRADPLRVPLSHVDSMTYRRLERRDTAVFAGLLTLVVVRSVIKGSQRLN
jgi:hypothetical protein